RRHTMSDRDWSSDVCSSDLGEVVLDLVDVVDPSLVDAARQPREPLAEADVREPEPYEGVGRDTRDAQLRHEVPALEAVEPQMVEPQIAQPELVDASGREDVVVRQIEEAVSYLDVEVARPAREHRPRRDPGGVVPVDAPVDVVLVRHL